MSTSEMTAAEAVHATAGPVGSVGGAFMLHPDTMGRATEQGYNNPFAFYFAGRGGVLGDVDADVVIAAFGWFEPGLVRPLWEEGVAVHGAREASRRYAQACAAWGRDHLAGVDGLDRLAELGERVVRAADVSGLPLFAGWRAEPLADDAPGRAMQLLHVLREWRGAVHLVATTAAGLTPIQAILANDGEARAAMFGWPQPYPDVAGLADAHREAETLTDKLCAPVVETALDAAERAELASLIATAHAAAVPA